MSNLNADQATVTRPSPRTRMSRANRRTQLVGCAVRAFAEKGLERAGHGDVALLADVSVAAVFDYFPTRELLVKAVLEEVADFWLRITEEEADAAPDPHSRLYQVVMRCVDAVSEHRHHVKVWLDWTTSIDKQTWPEYLLFNERIITGYEALIERGKNDGFVRAGIVSADAARIIAGQAQMILTMRLSGLSRDKIAAFIRHYVNAALDFEASS